MAFDLVRARLAAQRLVPPRHADPVAVVRALLAVQAQDYRAGLWAIGQRTDAAREVDVEAALAARVLVRTWPMRGTLHIVHADDLRWLVRLLAPRVHQRAAARHRQLDLDAKVFARARGVVERALAGGHTLTRPELFARLARARIDPRAQRGAHILGALAMDTVICYAAHRGKQATFALVDEWVPAVRDAPTGDEALAELARRYLDGHGPASAADLAWWAGLTLGEARRAIAAAGDRASHVVDGVTYHGGAPARATRAPRAHLLSAWDEYTVGYRDRGAILDPAHHQRTLGALAWVVAIDGRIAGVWQRTPKRDRVTITVDLFAPAPAAHAALARAADRYGAFVGRPAELVLAGVTRARRRPLTPAARPRP